MICEQVSHTIIPDQTSTEVPWPFGVEAHVLKSATLCLELGTYSSIMIYESQKHTLQNHIT